MNLGILRLHADRMEQAMAMVQICSMNSPASHDKLVETEAMQCRFHESSVRRLQFGNDMVSNRER